jgi:hypothetical protein
MGHFRPIPATLCAAALLAAASARAEDAPPPLRNPGQTERVESRLVQFEVRVSRKGAPVPGLGAKDFDIELGGKPLQAFTVDDMCTGAPAPPPGTRAARPGSFMFYFDEPELTVDGRHRAVEVAKLVAPALLARGHDILILRNGDAVRMETKWTHDEAEISAALDRIASDPGKGDSLRTSSEELRAENLIEQLEGAVRVANMEAQNAFRQNITHPPRTGPKSVSGGGLSPPPGAPPANPSGEGPDDLGKEASMSEERIVDATVSRLMGELTTVVRVDVQRTEHDVERLRGAVQSLALRGSPKGVVYFSDTLRRDPGDAVVHAISSDAQFERLMPVDKRWRTEMSHWDADAKLRALVRDASSYDVRFYAVEGRGLGKSSDWVRASQDTLASLALDTGGLSFLNGIAPQRIADRMVDDQACWYLVSFAPAGWDTDRPLNLGVWPKKPGLHVQTRSALVIPSRAALTQTRLIAAHFGDPALEDHPLSVSVYPVGGSTDALQVLAQVRLPEGGDEPARDTLWDIGFVVVSDGETVAHTSSRVTWRGHGQPPVYQTTLSLPAGPYEIIAVAQDAAGDAVRSGRISGSWPSSTVGGVTLSLPALAQPQRGGIVEDAGVKQSGIIVRNDEDPMDPRAPLAIVTVACVDKRPEGILRAERRLVGESEAPFPVMDLTVEKGQCVQIRDLVAANSLGAGSMTYIVRIVSGDAEVNSRSVAFDVADLPAAPDAVIAPPAK